MKREAFGTVVTYVDDLADPGGVRDRAGRARRPVQVPGHHEQAVGDGGERGVVVEAGAAGRASRRSWRATAIVSVAPWACSVCASSLANAVSSGRSVGGAGLEVDVDAVVAVLGARAPRCARRGRSGWRRSRAACAGSPGSCDLDARLDVRCRAGAPSRSRAGRPGRRSRGRGRGGSRSARRRRSAGSGAAGRRSSRPSSPACRRRRAGRGQRRLRRRCRARSSGERWPPPSIATTVKRYGVAGARCAARKPVLWGCPSSTPLR